MRLCVLCSLVGVVLALGCSADVGPGAAPRSRVIKPAEDRMSPMGRVATRRRELAARGLPPQFASGCDNEPDCGDEGDGPAGGQAELSIATDATGQHVVLGFNDTRGFSLPTISVSGFAFSDDGGRTFTDGGQLPTPGNDTVAGQTFPQVFGDPDVKYLGDCNFVYSSIMLAKFSDTQVVQTMCVHRSTDCGHTWTGPFAVTAASNPNGLFSNGQPADAADKEFLDFDPDSGRVIISWSNFTPAPTALGGVEISTSYSDDILSETPTWAPRAIVATGITDGQGSIPRFAGRGSDEAYIAWRRFPSRLTNTIGFARSTDDGVTWSEPVDLGPQFGTMDQVLGNDRVNTSPSLAVDKSSGRHRGTIYVVHSDNDSQDGADIMVQRSTDHGLTFSPPLALNSRPGFDRAQWFPWVTVDSTTGRVYVFYYDQQIATTGDLSETTYTFSDDGGQHWSPPRPLTDRPFRAGFGNDTGQPNLGDYNQAVAQRGSLFVVWAETHPVGFADGEPTSASFTIPDFHAKRVRADSTVPAGTVSLDGVSFVDSGHNDHLDPGELATMRFRLHNYDTNPLNARTLRGVTGFLSTSTPGVRVVSPVSLYGNLDPDQISGGNFAYLVFLAPDFVAGTDIEFELLVISSGGLTRLHHTQHTGTPSATTIFAENFDGVATGALPAGWTTTHVGGANTVPWTTSASFCGASSNAAFHPNAEDGVVPGAATRFERLSTPVFQIPANAKYVTLDFDVCYDTEDDPAFRVLAYDGFLLRFVDFTPGRIARAVLAEAFADELTTGTFQHYPKHFPRSGNRAYFQDMSAWAGDSGGVQHVHMRLPGMEGSTVLMRFEFTQDSIGTCADVRPDHACGVMVDNIVMQSVVIAAPPPTVP